MAELIYPKLSYTITGLCFQVHNELGRYAREKQYADEVEKKLKEEKINYVRELAIGDTGNIVDFLIEDKIILELKAKRILLKEDYYQTQRYLQSTGHKLAILVNFRAPHIIPKRVLRLDQSKRFPKN